MSFWQIRPLFSKTFMIGNQKFAKEKRRAMFRSEFLLNLRLIFQAYIIYCESALKDNYFETKMMRAINPFSESRFMYIAFK